MRVAYVILVHWLPGQVERLVRRLEVPGVEFFLHVDRSAGQGFAREIEERLEGVSNVHWVPSRRVRWGDWTIAAAMLDGLRAVHEAGSNPAQTVVLSGQDYPIKPPEDAAVWLGDRPDEAFMFRDPLPRRQWANERGGLDRIEYPHVHVHGVGGVRLPWRRRFPPGFRPYGGSQSISLGRPQLRHVVEVASSEQRIMRFFRHVANPDEVFFQTVLMSSPLRDTVVNDNLRYIRWMGGSSPEVLTVDDLRALEKSAALFARKFDTTMDASVLDEIDRRLLEQVPSSA
jgi:core-2/I-Branching enzyme